VARKPKGTAQSTAAMKTDRSASDPNVGFIILPSILNWRKQRRLVVARTGYSTIVFPPELLNCAFASEIFVFRPNGTLDHVRRHGVSFRDAVTPHRHTSHPQRICALTRGGTAFSRQCVGKCDINLRNAKMQSQPPFEVVSCMHDSAASKSVTRALKSERLAPVPLNWRELVVERRRSKTWAAMVYDLEPRDGRTADVIRRFHDCVPAGPILVYTPPAHDIGRFIERHVRNDRVLVRIQCGSEACEVGRLRDDVRRMVAEIPGDRLLKMVTQAVPNMPRKMVDCVKETMRWLSAPDSISQMTTESVARSMGTTVRTLERSTADPNLPNPKELMNWVTLLYVALVACCEDVSPGQAGRKIGLSGNGLCRIRRRLLSTGESVLWKSDGKNGAVKFALVFSAFVKRCGVPARVAFDIIGAELSGNSAMEDVRTMEWARTDSA
jgi:hypothetical protein